jgi:TRAP transporter TAXI family solute receptor
LFVVLRWGESLSATRLAANRFGCGGSISRCRELLASAAILDYFFPKQEDQGCRHRRRPAPGGLAMTLHRLLAAAVAAAVSWGAEAQTLGIGSTQPGSWTHSASSAVAKVVVEKTGLKMLVQPQGSEPTSSVDANVLQFSIVNGFDLTFLATGSGYHEGEKPRTNLRTVAVMTPLLGAMFVRKDSAIQSIPEIKGKRVPAGFEAQKTIKQSMSAHLANANLSWTDVRPVPAPTVPRAADDFAAGKADTFYFALGSAKVLQVSAAVGGLRVLPLDDAPEAMARMRKLLPGAYFLVVEPSKAMEGIEKPTRVLAQDMVLSTNAKVSEETVYKIAKALHASKAELVATFVGLGRFSPDRMATEIESVPFHPGAEKFYREIGAWPPKKS